MYDESSAKATYLQTLQDIAATQELSEDLRLHTRNLSIGFTIIAGVFVCLRFAARWRQAVPIGTDDWLILVSLVLLLGNFGMNLVCTLRDIQCPARGSHY